jgi:hypothetical protein
MTKANKTLTEAVEETVASLTVPSSTPEVDSNDYWKREAALEKAIQFHKTNGGMMHPGQLVDHAHIFLTFLNGETK